MRDLKDFWRAAERPTPAPLRTDRARGGVPFHGFVILSLCYKYTFGLIPPGTNPSRSRTAATKQLTQIGPPMTTLLSLLSLSLSLFCLSLYICAYISMYLIREQVCQCDVAQNNPTSDLSCHGLN